jgi:hypothetical protein
MREIKMTPHNPVENSSELIESVKEEIREEED